MKSFKQRQSLPQIPTHIHPIDVYPIDQCVWCFEENRDTKLDTDDCDYCKACQEKAITIVRAVITK